MTKVISEGSKNQEYEQKNKYRVRNWNNYNRSIVGRGDITQCFDESLAEAWHYDRPDQRMWSIYLFR